MIKRITTAARRHCIRVRWYDGFTGVGLLTFNPNQQSGWIHMELILPFVEPSRRLTIRLDRKNDERQFKEIYLPMNKCGTLAKILR